MVLEHVIGFLIWPELRRNHMGKCSEETKKKISASRMGIPAWNKGCAPSEASRIKMREAHLGKKLSKEHRDKLVAHLQKLWEKKRGTKLQGQALENARAGIKICNAKTRILYAQQKHFLSAIDVDKLIAVCSICGEVPITRCYSREIQFQCRLASKKIKVVYLGQALERWNAQQGVCAICQKPMQLTGTSANSVCADHDHTTQILRGFLHSNCNRGLGYFNDDPARLRQAAEYLERYQAQDAVGQAMSAVSS
jgi:cytochrome c-type biogenesis protein CcmE